MNLIMSSILLLAMLALHSTLIYGYNSNGNGRKHSSAASSSLLNEAKLVMSMESGDVLVRTARRAAATAASDPAASGVIPPVADALTPPGGAVAPASAPAGGDNGNKMGKGNDGNFGSSHRRRWKKLNKNSPADMSFGNGGGNGGHGGSGGRKPIERKHSLTGANQKQPHQHHHQQQQQQQQHGGNGNGGKNGKQRQVLKSQSSHQGAMHHGKRNGGGGGAAGAGGGKLKSDRNNNNNNNGGEKIHSTVNAEKPTSTCRYAKSDWSECDAKTNMRTRTLTLKKGESNCLSTRTVQKKCKKSCRYEKGSWSECVNGQMARLDKLKTTSDPVVSGGTAAVSSCEPTRTINKRCNPSAGGANNKSRGGGGGGGGKGNKERRTKDKALRLTPQPA